VSVDGAARTTLGGAGDPEAASPERPEPRFEVLGTTHLARAAVPTLRLRIAVREPSGRPVYTIALSTLVTVEPAKRRYSDAERERLRELFGPPERWASTTGSFRWTQADVLVPRFTGEGEFDLDLPCSYDHEVAAAKYFAGLEAGEAPMRLHFNGSIFYEASDGRMQLAAIPWDCSVRFAMPVEVWRGMIAEHFPFRRWIALDPHTVERLAACRGDRGLPSFDAVVDELLDEES
jgi:hypothetical protein